jgi:quercetin dioxygenase-like cupin family protein
VALACGVLNQVDVSGTDLHFLTSAHLQLRAAAQGRTPIMMTRIYTGADGLSRAENIEMTLDGNVSEMMKATGVEFSRRPPGPVSDWHVGPRRQFVITLSGRAELEVGGGQKVQVGPGHINLIEDTTGKGHTTRNVGPDDRIVVTIPLADQQPRR